MSQSKNGSQSFSAPQRKEGSLSKDVAAISLFLQPLEREVHKLLQQCIHTRCICAGEDTSIVQGEKVVCLAGYFWLQQLASLIPGDLAKCGVNSACRIAPCPQVIVKFTTFFKLNVYVA